MDNITINKRVCSKTFPLAPLLCIMLYEAHTQFFTQRSVDSVVLFQIMIQLTIESLPLLISHHFALKLKNNSAIKIWTIGFIVYPIIHYLLLIKLPTYQNWTLLNIQLFLVSSLISIITFIKYNNKRTKVRNEFNYLSLDSSIIFTLFILSIIIAAGFNNVQHSLDGNITSISIDIKKITKDFNIFLNNLWQIIIISSMVFFLYALNRHILIKEALTNHGVLVYLSLISISTLSITPIFNLILINLPMSESAAWLNLGIVKTIYSPESYKFIFLVFAISVPLILVFEKKSNDAALANISEMKTIAELSLLQQQIQPHFLFNTLNNLYSLTLEKSDLAPDLIIKLSKLFRYTVYEGQNNNVILTKEIEYLKDYISIQKIRFSNRCVFDLEWPNDKTDRYKIAPLLIITILENAFKHGVELSANKTKLEFRIKLIKNKLTIFCKNKGGYNKPIYKGVGLDNLHRRLEYLYPGRHLLKSDKVGEYWVSKMTLELDNA